MQRVVNFLSFMLAGLSGPGQDVNWCSDEDPMLANEKRSREFLRVFGRASATYLNHRMGDLNLRTVHGSTMLEDLAAVADLIAGATAEFLSNEETRVVSPLVVPMIGGVSSKTRRICRWLAVDDVPLKRIVLAVDRRCEEGKNRLRLISFVGLSPPGLYG